MKRLVDRVLERIVPRSSASACSGAYFCNSAGHPGLWWRFCCAQTGCEWDGPLGNCY